MLVIFISLIPYSALLRPIILVVLGGMNNLAVGLKEPFRLDRNRADLSLLEGTTLRFLGIDLTPPPELARAAHWWEVA